MVNAAAPPELPPMVARPSGPVVNLTPASRAARGSTSVSTKSAYTPDTVSYSRPRWLPCASLPRVDEHRRHDRHPLLVDQGVEGRDEGPDVVAAVLGDDERDGRAGDILL